MPVRTSGSGSTRRRVALVVGVAAAVVVVDQVTKTLALHHLREPRHVVGPLWLELTFNPGAAFGLGRGATPVVETVVVLLIAGLAVFAGRATRRAGVWAVAGCGALIGGAAGNLVDRLLRGNGGAVIDFIDVAQFGRRELWPIFNVADASIVVGAIVVAVAYAFGSDRGPSGDRAAGAGGGDADAGGAGAGASAGGVAGDD